MLPGGARASTVHRGPYDRIGPGYEGLTSWIAANGKQVSGPPRELYLNDPNAEGQEPLTEILFPTG